MLRRALSVCAVLGFVSAAHAGLAITLVPDQVQPVGGYLPGSTVNVDVFAQLTPGTPSVPGPGGSTSLVRVRYLQLDFADTDAALGLTPVFNHPTADPDFDEVPNPVPFWNLSGAAGCAGDETSCGTNYFIEGSLAADDLVSITYTGLTSNPNAMVILNQTQLRIVGSVDVTFPTAPGTYILDVLNADETDPNQGAELRWGFGSTADPTDPSSPLRANVTAGTQGITGGRLPLTVAIPEPATLALLGMGGLAAAFRRRRSA